MGLLENSAVFASIVGLVYRLRQLYSTDVTWASYISGICL